jgi:predicted glycosyltransferase
LRNREEIEQRLNDLVSYLARNDPAEEQTVRTHARALDLVWVLHPGTSFFQQLNLLTRLVSNWEEPPTVIVHKSFRLEEDRL